jgi:hypothetical protein
MNNIEEVRCIKFISRNAGSFYDCSVYKDKISFNVDAVDAVNDMVRQLPGYYFAPERGSCISLTFLIRIA